MPIYFGHTNTKGLEVSPLLKTKGINLLRASPNNVKAVAKPLVKQPGYSSYLTFLPAFMKAQNEKTVIRLSSVGFITNFPVDQCIELMHPALVVDYGGPIPAKHVEVLNGVGFERIKMNKREHIVRFPMVTLEEVREIRKTSPNLLTPAPANTVNLESFDSWVLFLRLISNLLRTHMYPAFRDDGHYQEEIDDIIDMVTLKRRAATELRDRSKRQKLDDDDQMQVEDEEEGEVLEVSGEVPDINLSKAKPIKSDEAPWGTIDKVPNCNGLFFPYIAELASPDTETVPSLIEEYMFQSLGDTPEKQLERIEKIRRAWGLIGKTEAGNVSAHMCKVISLALQSQARVYPIIQEEVYEGCVLLGARLFVGLNGMVHRTLSYSKLQSELGGFSTHSRTLSEIAEVCGVSSDLVMSGATTMRKLRTFLMKKNINEEKRDQIRKLAVHLHFKERFLAVNSGTLSELIDDLATPELEQSDDLPMHHSALFSNDAVLVALSAFGYQAPSFNIENCPKVELKGSAPQTLVIRQKPLDIACQDWRSLLETKEIRNNPRNLSRANRDRSLVGNDKTIVWGRLVKLRISGGDDDPQFGNETVNVALEQDKLDEW